MGEYLPSVDQHRGLGEQLSECSGGGKVLGSFLLTVIKLAEGLLLTVNGTLYPWGHFLAKSKTHPN